MALPKLVITDIDGVWTDGGMFYDQTGNEWKKFNTSDSAGVLFLRMLEIPFAIMTGEDTQIVQRRADKLKVEHLYLGAKNKVKLADELRQTLDIEWSEIAFIGDDINDLALLKKVGWSAAPSNAPSYIKSVVKTQLSVRGGDGAFRAFVELILEENAMMESVLEKYTQSASLIQ